jgi:hypothetical protein
MNGTITLNVTLLGQTKAIEFEQEGDGKRAYNYSDFYALLGRGGKTHPCYVMAVRWASIEEARKAGYRQICTLENGEVWGFNHSVNVLNRNTVVTGFRVADTTSQHSGGRH